MKQILMAFTFGFNLALFLFLIIEMFAYSWWGIFLLSEDACEMIQTAIGDYLYAIKIVVVALLSISSVFTIEYVGNALNKKENNNDDFPPQMGVKY